MKLEIGFHQQASKIYDFLNMIVFLIIPLISYHPSMLFETFGFVIDDIDECYDCKSFEVSVPNT